MRLASKRHTLLTLIALTISTTSYAGGPIGISGSSTPLIYANPAITLHLEGTGTLGTRSNAQADALVTNALGLWNNVATSNINLSTDDSSLGNEVDINNYTTFLPATSSSSASLDNLNPIVYDHDGQIIDAFFGAGASDRTAGVAFSVANNTNLTEGYAIINGKDLPGFSNPAIIEILIAHEIGHFIGLDHTQTDIDNSENLGFSTMCQTRADKSEYAVMYPFICRDVASLHADDISSIASLYPNTNFDQNFGIIEGQFVDDTGTPILGANIYAKNVATGEAISIVSDYLIENNGRYKLHLPAGQYTLHANSINPLFFGASAVGPYALSATDTSFQSPNPITDVEYKGDGDTTLVITIDAGDTLDISFNTLGALVATNINPSTTTSGSSGGDGGGGSAPVSYLLLAMGLIFTRLFRIRANLRANLQAN